jgi:tetratricopeptide (TPR) repeat protein
MASGAATCRATPIFANFHIAIVTCEKCMNESSFSPRMNLRILALGMFVALTLFCVSCTESQLYMLKGNNDKISGHYAEAITNYQTAIETSGPLDDRWKILDMRIEMARLYLQLGDSAGALSNIDMYIVDYPKFDKGYIKSGAAEIYRDRGDAKFLGQDYAGAISDFTKAIQLHRKDTAAWYGRGAAKWKLRDFTGATTDFDTGLALHRVNARAYDMRGVAEYGGGDLSDAEVDCSRAIELSPNLAF